MKKFLCLLVLLPQLLFAQDHVIDSLQVALTKAPSDSAKSVLLFRLTENYWRIDPVKAKEYGHKALETAKKIKSPAVEAKALNNLGVTYLILSHFDAATDYQYQSLKLREQLKDSAGIANSFMNLGNIHFRTAKLDQALTSYKKALRIAAILQDKKILGKLYNNLGSVYEAKEDFKKALPYLEKAIALKKEQNETQSLSTSLFHIGQIYLKSGNFEKGLAYMQQSLKIDTETNNDINRVVTLRGISEAYQQHKEFKKALTYGFECLELAKKLNSNFEIWFAADRLQNIYQEMGDYKNAYNYLSMTYAYNDSLYNETANKNRSEIEIKYETQKKELENAKLLADKKFQQHEINEKNNLQLIGSFATALLLLLSVLLYRSWQKQKRSNLLLQEINVQIQHKNKKINVQQKKLMAQNEVVLRQNNELEKLNSFKTKIFSIISHDLRSPFASLKTMLLFAQSNELSNADRQNLFKLLEEKCDFSTNLLNNVFIWANNQLAGHSMKPEAVHLATQIEESTKLLSMQLKQKQLTIENNVPENLTLVTDKERLNFVIRNLLTNAVKFSFQGGKIEIHAAENNKDTLIAITDSGKGIPQEQQRKLFTEERFTTIGTAKEKGSGLGLLLCKELLESMEGAIWFESEPGKGTTFFVKLPKISLTEKIENFENSLQLNSGM